MFEAFETPGALPCPGQAWFKPMPGGRKASMEVGPREACQGVRIPSMRRGPFCQKCFRRPRPAPGLTIPWIPHDGVLCRPSGFRASHATRFRAASPPYPSTAVDFRKAPDRLTKPVQANWSSSAQARPPSHTAARQNSLFRFHPMPTYGRYRHSRHSLTNGRSCQPPSPAPPCPLPLRSGYAPFPVVCRNVYLLSPLGPLAKKPQKA